MRSMSLDNRS
jgi:hypothetical protein